MYAKRKSEIVLLVKKVTQFGVNLLNNSYLKTAIFEKQNILICVNRK